MQENKSSRNKAGTHIFRVFAVMLMVTFLSCHVISGSIAKYVSSGNGSDAARVASFSVEALGDDENDDMLSLRYGTDQKSKKYKINVSNHSEVAVSYTVVITFRPDDVQGMLTAKLEDRDGVYDRATHSFTWLNAGSLEIGGNADRFLTITAVGAQLPTESDGTASKTTRYDFETKVLFEQID